jgi:hypothetical protein
MVFLTSLKKKLKRMSEDKIESPRTSILSRIGVINCVL